MSREPENLSIDGFHSSNHEKRNEITNPLKLFPSKSDTITKAFFSVEAPRQIRKIENTKRWLQADKLHPEFGIKGDSQETYVRRTFRRIESSKLFTQPKIESTSLAELNRPVKTSNKKFVLVEESRLAELTKFENILRDERAKLGEQCTWVLSDFEIDTRLPVPATRIAMQNLCESEMRKYSEEIMKLNNTWTDFQKKNHYNKPHLYLHESYLNNAPIPQRTMKLKLLQEAVKTWRKKLDRDTMSYEDDLSFLTGKYLDSKSRRKDYDRYFILATRFGPFSESEFYHDSTPGKRYFKKATLGALRFQRCWDRFWSVKKLRRYRAARMIQKIFRCFSTYKRWHPIVMIRLRVGRRAYYRFCWPRWVEYIQLVKKIKKMVTLMKENWRDLCFHAWKDYVTGINQHRNSIKKRFLLRLIHAQTARFFIAWFNYVDHIKQLKRRVRRTFQMPHFDMWVEYTKASKREKKLHRSACAICVFLRARGLRLKYLRMKHAIAIIKHLAKLIFAKYVVGIKREKIIEIEFRNWQPSEEARLIARSNEAEKRRLIRMQHSFQDKEKVCILELKRHLKTPRGSLQLKEMMRLGIPKQYAHQFGHSQSSSSSSPLVSPFASPFASSSTLSPFPAPFRSHVSLNLNGRPRSAQTQNKILVKPSPSPSPSPSPQGSANFRLGLGALTNPHVRISDMGQEGKNIEKDNEVRKEGKERKVSQTGDNPPFLQSIQKQIENNNNNGNNKTNMNSLVTMPKNDFSFNSLLKFPNFFADTSINQLQSSSSSSRRLMLSNEQQDRISEQLLLTRYCDIIRKLQRHEFETKFPPFVVCPFPPCRCVSTTETQYHNHVLFGEHHLPSHHPSSSLSENTEFNHQFSHFHLLLRNVKGLEAVKSYLISTLGFGTVSIHRLECWVAIQEWYRTPSSSKLYYTRAENILDTFLKEGSSHDCGFWKSNVTNINNEREETKRMENYSQLLTKLNAIKMREFEGFYRPRKATPGFLRYILGIEGLPYQEWTDELILPPEIFYQVEWECFYSLFLTFHQYKEHFQKSEEYQHYLDDLEKHEKERMAKLLDQYKDLRLLNILSWTREFIVQEKELAIKAFDYSQPFVEEETEAIVLALMEMATREKVFEIQYQEQVIKEGQSMVIDESIYWAEDNIVEWIFEFYTRALIDKMFTFPECRKGMLEYAGLLKKNTNGIFVKKKLLIDMNRKNEGKEIWFKQFFQDTLKAEQENLPLEIQQAAIKIQKIIRGWRHKKIAKKEFIKTFTKHFDPVSNQCYYVNVNTGESTWEKPLMIKYLYPNSKW